MKKVGKITLTILSFSIFLLSCESNVKSKSSIIGNPKIIGQLEVAEIDLPDSVNWAMANNSCKELGEGWRLPSKEELYYLYKKKDTIGGFNNFNYWTSTEIDSSSAWCYTFTNGYPHRYNKINPGFVRAVKSIDK